jgi:NTE family protein
MSDIETLDKYGFYKGQKFLDWIGNIIFKRTNATYATFKHFKDAGYIDLYIFATNLNTNSLTEFSFETTPDVQVADAIRCSMSIPGFFEAYKLNNQIYVDGGVLYNYPLTCFDKNGINEETLGLYIGVTTDKGIDSGLKFGEPKKYAVALIETLLKAQDEALYKSPDNMRRTIFINPCNISATNFKLTTDDKITLFKAGQEAVVKYFESH